MKVSKLTRTVLAMALTFVLSAAAHAVPWSNPNGTVPGVFSWSNGGSDNGLFGDPTIVGSSFVFSPNNFVATASNGSASTVSDRLFFTLDIAPGFQFGGITISEFGDYSILGGGAVAATGALFVTDLNSGSTQSSLLSTNPVFPVSTNTFANGLWSGVASVTMPNGVTRVTVVLNNVLQATSQAGGTSLIEKKGAGAGIQIDIFVPEPATAGLFGGVAAMLLTRRRRSA